MGELIGMVCSRISTILMPVSPDMNANDEYVHGADTLGRDSWRQHGNRDDHHGGNRSGNLAMQNGLRSK
jgi:hypothetical protein